MATSAVNIAAASRVSMTISSFDIVPPGSVGGSLTSLPHNRLTLATRADENPFWSESPTGPPVFTISGFALALHLLRMRAVVASRNLVEMTELRSDDRLFHLTLCPNKLSEPGLSFSRILLDHCTKLAVGSEPRPPVRYSTA